MVMTIPDDFRDAPLIGIEYLVEIVEGDRGELGKPSYRCELSSTVLKEADDVVPYLVSANHRLNYLKRFYPTAYKKFSKGTVPKVESWNSKTFQFLESVIMRIENKNGRLRPQVVASDATYQKTRANIRRKIETGQHFR